MHTSLRLNSLLGGSGKTIFQTKDIFRKEKGKKSSLGLMVMWKLSPIFSKDLTSRQPFSPGEDRSHAEKKTESRVIR